MEERLLMANIELRDKDEVSFTSEIKEAADFYRERLTELAKMRFDLTTDIQQAQEEIKKINTVINSLKAGSGVPQSELMLFTDVSANADGKLIIEYFTPGAGWEPLYDFRFRELDAPLDLVFNAKVFQSTREDWNEVSLRLIQGLPKENADLPEFDRRYIHEKRPRSEKVRAEYRSGVGTIKGTLTDMETGEPLPFVNIVVEQGGEQITGATTDFEGRYTIRPVPSGYCDLIVSYVGYNAKKIKDIKVSRNKIAFVDIELESGVKLEEFEVVEYAIPLIHKDGGTSGGAVKRSEILRMPGRVARSIISTTSLFLDERAFISSPRISYSLDHKVNLPGSGDGRLISIKTESVPVDYKYRAVASIDSDVYLVARIFDWGNLELLSGRSTVYFEGAFTGQTQVDANSVKDTLEISLGIDDNIILERRPDEALCSESSFGNKVKKELHWNIVVRNNKSHPIGLEIIDQVPLSRLKAVNIEVLDKGGASYLEKEGRLTWEMVVEPNSSEEVGFGYEVKYPDQAVVYGDF
jgi:hypothetical protein